MTDRYFGSHEFQAREEAVKSSSDRSFGFVFAAFCAVVGGLSLYHGGSHWAWWLGAAAIFAILAVAAPRILAPLNRLWAKFGLLLHRIVSPIMLGLIFFACILPFGVVMRLLGKDPLRRRFEPGAESYWIRRDPPGPSPETFKNQF
jgi:hypothetical protein